MTMYVIEHLEQELYPWCLIEYESISKIAGKEHVLFTNIARKADSKKLQKFGKVFKDSVQKLDLPKDKICILDPEAKNTLTSGDSKQFEYILIGGILGDFPPKKRTKEELTSKFPKDIAKRNLGKEQFSTDNAVFIAEEILQHNKRLEDIPFIDNPTIKINEVESVDLPFRYPLINGKPKMSEKIIQYLKNKKGF